MIQAYINQKRTNPRFACDILLAALVLAILTGLGPEARTLASGGQPPAFASNRVGMLDPFSLKSMAWSPPAGSGGFGSNDSGGVLGQWQWDRPPIRIPFRPIIRSPFRPPCAPLPKPPVSIPKPPRWWAPGWGRPWWRW